MPRTGSPLRLIRNWVTGMRVRYSMNRMPVRTQQTEEFVKLSTGETIYVHLHRPVKAGRYPGVFIVPGGLSPGTAYDGMGELRAEDISAMGYAVMHYDPSGRGRSTGVEDFCGARHQTECADLIERFASMPEVDPSCIGILSFSLGISIASGALYRRPDLPVSYLFDWEGPSNRRVITLDETIEIFNDHPCSDDAFWAEREAVGFIGSIGCGYFRYQSVQDHVQGAYVGHAIELVNLAARGRARWTRCNDNAPDIIYDPAAPDEYGWVPEMKDHAGTILRYLLELGETCIR